MTDMELAVCSRGHALSSENIYTRPGGKEECRECRRIVARAQYRKKLPKSETRKKMDCRHAKRYSLKYPEKLKAKRLLRTAVEAGQIVRPTFCERCKTETKVQGHHHDYSKPLEVEWLCVLCHIHEHDARPRHTAEASKEAK